MESPRIRLWRCKYLDQIAAARKAGKPIVYLDETWYDTHERLSRCWTDGSPGSELKTSRVRGKRLLLLHAGGENGWVSDAFFISGKNIKDCSADYHGDMNANVFEEWFKNQLCPNLEPRTCIVMDNASYHSRILEKIPNASWKKGDIIDFLQAKKVDIPEPPPLKPCLLNMVQSLQLQKVMAVDAMAESLGHEVLRLPPYHCVFNPIELVWGELKGYIRRHNVNPTCDESVVSLVRQAADLITTDKWKQYVGHAEKEESNFKGFDDYVDSCEDTGQFVFEINGDESSEDEL